MAEEDILFGKNRHLFGGVAPSNMRRFEVKEYGSTEYILHAELPTDTVIDGQTICSVAGAVIRMKKDGYPKDEFDGVEACTIYCDTYHKSGMLPILGNEADIDFNTWYFRAFPFSTQGVYNRNEVNSCVLNDLATLDDSDSWHVTTKYVNDQAYDPSAILTITNMIKGQIFAYADSWDGYVIRYRNDRYPINELDGTGISETEYYEAAALTSTIPYIMTNMSYYCAIFPYHINYDGSKTYSYNIKNRFSFVGRGYSYIFGYDLDTNDPNPNTRVTYPSDVDNAFFEPGKMDYSGGTFNYGGWKKSYEACRLQTIISDINDHAGFFPMPVILKNETGLEVLQQVHILDNDDYRKSAGSGSDVSESISDTNSDYNVMMRWPKIYTHRELTSDGIYKFRCSDCKIDDTWECWCNYDKDGNEIDNFYTAVYSSYTDAQSRLRSLSGKTITRSISPEIAVSYATKNGDGWHIEPLADRLLIQDLLVLMAKTTDCQKAYGKGICGGSTAVTTTGTMDTYGLFWGSQDPTEGVKVFGMENWWGNHERYIAGAITVSGSYRVKLTRGTQDGSTATDYNLTGDGYLNKGAAMETAGNIKEMDVYDFGRLPVSSGGSSTTYECDEAKISTSGTYYAMAGGNNALSEHSVGPFHLRFLYSGSSSTTSTERCAAISLKCKVY